MGEQREVGEGVRRECKYTPVIGWIVSPSFPARKERTFRSELAFQAGCGLERKTQIQTRQRENEKSDETQPDQACVRVQNAEQTSTHLDFEQITSRREPLVRAAEYATSERYARDFCGWAGRLLHSRVSASRALRGVLPLLLLESGRRRASPLIYRPPA